MHSVSTQPKMADNREQNSSLKHSMYDFSRRAEYSSNLNSYEFVVLAGSKEGLGIVFQCVSCIQALYALLWVHAVFLQFFSVTHHVMPQKLNIHLYMHFVTHGKNTPSCIFPSLQVLYRWHTDNVCSVFHIPQSLPAHIWLQHFQAKKSARKNMALCDTSRISILLTFSR